MLVVLLLTGDVVMAMDGPIRELSSSEKAAVLGGSLGLAALSRLLPDKISDSTSYNSYRANSLDRWWRARLHGDSGQHSNFLDNNAGALIAPTAALIALACMDIDRHEFSRDIPFFVAGTVTTGALTVMCKRVIDRPRPYCQSSGTRPAGRPANDGYHTESFFSGHSSMAFFAAGFTNNRLRRHMRREWRRDEYRSWRWASPLLTFGWATLVGGSRIHADKHHFTDVASGALVGYGLSELFYRLCYQSGRTQSEESSGHSQMFSVVIKF